MFQFPKDQEKVKFLYFATLLQLFLFCLYTASGDDIDQLSRDGFFGIIRKVICKVEKSGLAHYPIIIDIIQW